MVLALLRHYLLSFERAAEQAGLGAAACLVVVGAKGAFSGQSQTGLVVPAASRQPGSGRASLGGNDGLFRFGFAYRRQIDRPVAIVVSGSGGDKAGDRRDHRGRSYVVVFFIQAGPEVICAS